jgi:cytochrome c-type biogenesis protein CcmF
MLGLVLALGGAAFAQHVIENDDTPAPAGVWTGAATEINDSPQVAKRLFRDLVCQCGGCQRLPLFECRCGYAKQERAKIMAMIAGKDISTPAGEEAVYVSVRDAFMKEYGGQRALTVPLDGGFNRLAILVPVAVLGLAVILVLVIGRRWVGRGRRAAAAEAMTGKAVAAAAPRTRQQEDLEDQLDDELRDID